MDKPLRDVINHEAGVGRGLHSTENCALSELMVGGEVNADVIFRQTLLTISIGYLFMGRFFFVNFSLGVSWVGSFSSSETVNALIPDAVGGAEANQAAIDQLQGDIQSQGTAAATDLRTRFPIFPSLALSFGFQL